LHHPKASAKTVFLSWQIANFFFHRRNLNQSENLMGKKDNRRTPKMLRKKAQAKKKARTSAKIKAAKSVVTKKK
jgi:hypothetical protein